MWLCGRYEWYELINLEIILIITNRYVFHHVSACPTASDDLARVKLRNTCCHRLRNDIYTIRLFHFARQQLRTTPPPPPRFSYISLSLSLYLSLYTWWWSTVIWKLISKNWFCQICFDGGHFARIKNASFTFM